MRAATIAAALLLTAPSLAVADCVFTPIPMTNEALTQAVYDMTRGLGIGRFELVANAGIMVASGTGVRLALYNTGTLVREARVFLDDKGTPDDWVRLSQIATDVRSIVTHEPQGDIVNDMSARIENVRSSGMAQATTSEGAVLVFEAPAPGSVLVSIATGSCK